MPKIRPRTKPAKGSGATAVVHGRRDTNGKRFAAAIEEGPLSGTEIEATREPAFRNGNTATQEARP